MDTGTNSRTSYLGPFITMVVLMALIGFITSINQQFQVPIQSAYLQSAGSYENTFSTLLVFAFFLAYLLIGPLAARYLERNGYKKTLLMGVGILGLAFCIFLGSAMQYRYSFSRPIEFTLWDARIPLSYFIFVLGSFISGTGLTFLQASVNPYLIACDVKGTSPVQRQNIGGTGNSIMTTIGPLFVAYAVFRGQAGTDVDIQSIFLPMGVLILAMLLLYAIIRRLELPNLANTTAASGEELPHSAWRFSHLSLGVLALFCYVGVEVCIGSNFNLYAKSDLGMTGPEAAQMITVYWLCLLIGRFLSSFLSKVSAKVLLSISSLSAMILLGLAMLIQQPWLLIAIGFFHSVMWGAIFSLALEGLGKYTAKGTGLLMMGVVGGAVLPFAQGIWADKLGSWDLTWLLVLAGEAYMLFYALIGSRPRLRADRIER
ncbi:hypothetical protein HQ45_04690 [Porphyromonas crevioricanis]|uniref:L-fucose permease n=1 Tax=Porphyromonas crevioricanis TaxID=393921 RepID=A0A0A2FSK0_9PORP|nr:MFS transporter [Porphyromonas crevioricanis]KGN90104.1 hypothetical protein HQ45_04690 [Porphyromonas crevioricanis]KGN93137.1 hypothetical protein HQ38_09525 [Porphyromonas crevioricanis]GAD07408.1 glucose/galactose transporter [Porphyromonas crevioricanis JCM 13913]SQH72496.1 L-fucose permease [Porphyromonas crevioricanis]